METDADKAYEALLLGGSAAEIEEFLGFETGTFDHIPHYARFGALSALLRVREMESSRVFRPGLYYIVLSDLCRATEASEVLGNDIGKKRIETFILTCAEVLGNLDLVNYHLFLREIGDAVLMLFSSFNDAYQWWVSMNSWLAGRDRMWSRELDLPKNRTKLFKLEAKTIIHAGEVAYSEPNIPLSAAVNQVFKAEKEFRANELGITLQALACARPVVRSLNLRSRRRCDIKLPGNREPHPVYLIDKYPSDSHR